MSLALAMVATACIADLAPPDPVPASASAQEFSAHRAASHLPGIADQPHPSGTVAAERVREHLLDQLGAFELDAEVQSTVVESPLQSGSDGSTLVGQVHNVVAVIPGTEPTGQVLLVAHYDSVPHSPGAADDGAAVAAILETVRALQSGPALRNDVVIVLTDAEEPGLLGAAGFVRDHPLADGGGVVLNWEASGGQGPSTLFETSQGNGCMLDAFAAAPHPFGDSSTEAFLALSTHNTDFSVFRAAGFAGLNSVVVRGSAVYHTPQDSIENLSLASLQHHGANMLGMARTFGSADLGDQTAMACDDMVFLTAFGVVLRYPVTLALPLALLGIVILGGATGLARRHGLVTVPRVLAGFGVTLIPVALAGALAEGLWQAIVALQPGYADLGMGEPYRPEAYRLAVAAVTVAVVLGWYGALRRRIGPMSLATGALLWPALLGVVVGWLAPGASFLLVLPTLGAATGLGCALLLLRARRAWRLVALAVGAVPTVVILPQLTWELSAALGMASAAVVACVTALLSVPLLPLLELAFVQRGEAARKAGAVRRLLAHRTATLATSALLVGAILAGVGLAVDRFDPDHPRPAQLQYTLDADTATATWSSGDMQPSAWTCGHVGCEQGAVDVPDELLEAFPTVGSGHVLLGPAEVADLDAPELTVLDDRMTDDERIVELLVHSARQAPVLSMYVDQPVLEATVGDHRIEEVVALDGPWAFGLEMQAPPVDGMVVTLRLEPVDDLSVRLVDHSYGLDGLPGFEPRPPEIGIAMAPSDIVSVGSTVRLDATGSVADDA